MQEIIIDRAKWRSGGFHSINAKATGLGETLLLNHEGYMCCLGFMCNQLGVTKKYLMDVPTPDDVIGYEIPWLVDYLMIGYYNNSIITAFSAKAISINDSSFPQKTKEKQLKELFKENGLKLTFTGKYK